MADWEGIHVLVTRPAHQAEGLVAALADRGATVLSFPALTIHPAPLNQANKETLLTLGGYDYLIFISPNAVMHGMPYVLSHFHLDHFKPHFAAVGEGTADILKTYGVQNVIFPEADVGSEALLSILPSDLQDKKIFIFKGDSGNNVLEAGLTERGAMVRSCVCYQREHTQADPTPFIQALKHKHIHIAVVTSADSLRALHAWVPQDLINTFSRLPLVVASDRIGGVAKKMGFDNILNSKGADDRAIIETISAWVEQQGAIR
jgi:uroporphyrinogen-III synthase